MGLPCSGKRSAFRINCEAAGYGSLRSQGRQKRYGHASNSHMYHVYILASRRYGTLYVGVTNSLQNRLAQHRDGSGSPFVKAYGVYRLVYVESYDRADEAIAREKQLKRWKRDWKIELIERDNLEWADLGDLLT